MKITIHKIENHGDQNKEVVTLKVLQDCNADEYILTDTTYLSETTISNKFRHTFWFNSTAVKKGDFIQLFTGKGMNAAMKNKAQTTTHKFYWGVDHAVWNDTGDGAILFEIADRETKKAR